MLKIGIYFMIFVVFIFSGCSTGGQPSISNKKITPIDLKENEQIVYFIREDTFKAGAIDTFVGCSNKRFLLKSGEYTYCKLVKGINTLSYGEHTIGLFFTPVGKMQSPYSSNYMTHDFSNEKEIYILLKLDSIENSDRITRFSFNKIDKKSAINYMKNNDYEFRIPIDNETEGNNHLVALLNPSLVYAFDYYHNIRAVA